MITSPTGKVVVAPGSKPVVSKVTGWKLAPDIDEDDEDDDVETGEIKVKTDADTFKLKVVVVAHGAGIKFFLDDRTGTPWEKDQIDPEIYKRFVGLTKYGVEAYLCQITYKRLNIDPAKTKNDAFLKFVPSGVATVAELQTCEFCSSTYLFDPAEVVPDPAETESTDSGKHDA